MTTPTQPKPASIPPITPESAPHPQPSHPAGASRPKLAPVLPSRSERPPALLPRRLVGIGSPPTQVAIPAPSSPDTPALDLGEPCAVQHCVRVVGKALTDIADLIQRGLDEAGAAECGAGMCGMAMADEACQRYRSLGFTTCAAGQCAVGLGFRDRRVA